MKRTATVIAASLAALASAAVTMTAPAARAAGASAPTCSASQVEIWLGDGSGGGTAGTIYYPLEFSNIAKDTCSLAGIPRVLGISSADKPIGAPSSALKLGSRAPVTLAPGATAHAIIGIHDSGAVCGKGVGASGLRVYLPGRTQASTQIAFPFQTCRTGTMIAAEPIHAGTGIPGYTSS